MAAKIQSRSILYSASILGIAISLSAIIWRSYFADGIRQMSTNEWNNNSIVTGYVGLLMATLISHLVWLISSVILLIWGNKGIKAVMYTWILVTWVSIILDTSLFGYFAYYFITAMVPIDVVEGEHVVALLREILTIMLSVGQFYMLLLLIHIILAYLTIQVGYYASNLDPKKYVGQAKGYNRGQFLNQVPVQQEHDPYLEDQIHARQTMLANQAYQNGGYSRSADDLRYGIGGYGDKPVTNRYRRYASPDEIPPDYRRASRSNIESARY